MIEQVFVDFLAIERSVLLSTWTQLY